jgi:hypothetical protein
VRIGADIQKQFQALGVKVARTDTVEDLIAVWPENESSVMAFLECQTQWRVTSTMRQLIWLGLDYVAVRAVLDAEGHGRDVFEDLRVMEAAALPVLNRDD